MSYKAIYLFILFSMGCLSNNIVPTCKNLYMFTQGKDTAQLFSSGAHGWVRAWSVHRDGGLLGQFHAAHKPYGKHSVT